MINKVIHTYFTDYGYNLKQGFRHEKAFLEYLLDSIANSMTYFDEVIIYTDEEGYQLLVKSGVDEKHLLLFDFYPFKWDKRYWNFPKLMVYQAQKEPFLHVDLDAKILVSLPEELLKTDVLCERVRVLNMFSNERSNLPKRYWNNYDPMLPCSGILGGNKLAIFKDLYQVAKEVVTKKTEIGIEVLDNHRIALEEILLRMICNEKKAIIQPLDETMYEHLQGDLKLSV